VARGSNLCSLHWIYIYIWYSVNFNQKKINYTNISTDNNVMWSMFRYQT
jgi:hypothetical protein